MARGSATRRSASLTAYQRVLTAAGHGEITTEVAEPARSTTPRSYHQQYLAKNPGGYCGLGGTGVSCPIGTGVPASTVSPGTSSDTR